MPVDDVFAQGERERRATDSFIRAGTELEHSGVDFDAKLLTVGENVIEVYVCNTAANVYADYDHTKDWEPRFLALGYAKHTREFEKDSLSGGLFGPVKLEI